MTFSEFTKPYGPRRNPASKRFHDLAQRRLWPIRSHFLPPLPPRAAANLLSVSTDVPRPDTAQEEDNRAFSCRFLSATPHSASLFADA